MKKRPSSFVAAWYQESEDPDKAGDLVAFLEGAVLPEAVIILVFGFFS